jgi:hypothetical protein
MNSDNDNQLVTITLPFYVWKNIHSAVHNCYDYGSEDDPCKSMETISAEGALEAALRDAGVEI